MPHLPLARATVAVVLAGMLGACGQKGPLYLPTPPPAPQTKTPAASPIPAPAADKASSSK